MTRPPLTRSIGTAERTLQALLQTHLVRAGLDFPSWVVLTQLASGPMAEAALTGALIRGQVTAPDAVPALLADLAGRGLIAEGPEGWALADLGRTLFAPLRIQIGEVTAALEAGIAEADLETTHKVLNLLAERAMARP